MCSVTIRFNTFYFLFLSPMSKTPISKRYNDPSEEYSKFHSIRKKKKKEIQISYPSLSGNSPVSIDDPIGAVRLLIKTRVTR